MRCTILSSRLVSGSMELMAMPPVFFFLKVMLGGLRFRRMPTWRTEVEGVTDWE